MKNTIIALALSALAGASSYACEKCAPNLAGGPMGISRVAHKANIGYYETPRQKEADCNIWFQVDLGKPENIESVMVYPHVFDGWDVYNRYRYPARFKIEASDSPDMKNAAVIADCTAEDMQYGDVYEKIDIFKTQTPIKAQYVRMTVTKLNNFSNKYHSDPDYFMSLWRFEVWADGKLVSENKNLSDSISGDLGQHALLRAQRPEGEEAYKDSKENITDPKTWQPVQLKTHVPTKGVKLAKDSLFKNVMDRNANYLMNSFTVDDMLIEFRKRAGKPYGQNSRGLNNEWVNVLPSSAAGRFLMGAGNQLRWAENKDMRKKLNDIVDGIEECAQPNGYILGYPENEIFYFENGAYCRAWLTHGLLEADIAGNPKAMPMIRKFQNWFNNSPYLPELARRSGQGRQGVIASARMARAEGGTPQDIQTIQRYYQEKFWIDQLAARDKDAMFKYPYDRPHCYLLVSMESFMDMYFVTGDPQYLEAALGAWDIWTQHYQHIGGTISISENGYFPPDSNFIHSRTGELCGNVFWIFFNQRLHLLFPDEEKYANQIEQSIYNAAIANQDGEGKIRYHARLAGRKEGATDTNTCCEGQGTRIYGALPEFIYTLADNGVYVNLYAPSSLTYEQGGKKISLKMETKFPEKKNVKLTVSAEGGKAESDIRIRVPQWAARDMPIFVNGERVAVGKPGSYVSLNREWNNGDTITFSLPMEFRITKYRGQENVFKDADRHTHALEYGPFLMALTGTTFGENGFASMHFPASELIERLVPEDGKPLHFKINGMEDSLRFVPYYEVQDETMTCFQFYPED